MSSRERRLAEQAEKRRLAALRGKQERDLRKSQQQRAAQELLRREQQQERLLHTTRQQQPRHRRVSTTPPRRTLHHTRPASLSPTSSSSSSSSSSSRVRIVRPSASDPPVEEDDEEEEEEEEEEDEEYEEEEQYEENVEDVEEVNEYYEEDEYDLASNEGDDEDEDVDDFFDAEEGDASLPCRQPSPHQVRQFEQEFAAFCAVNRNNQNKNHGGSVANRRGRPSLPSRHNNNNHADNEAAETDRIILSLVLDTRREYRELAEEVQDVANQLRQLGAGNTDALPPKQQYLDLKRASQQLKLDLQRLVGQVPLTESTA